MAEVMLLYKPTLNIEFCVSMTAVAASNGKLQTSRFGNVVLLPVKTLSLQDTDQLNFCEDGIGTMLSKS